MIKLKELYMIVYSNNMRQLKEYWSEYSRNRSNLELQEKIKFCERVLDGILKEAERQGVILC